MILQLSAKQLEALINGICENIGLLSLPLSHIHFQASANNSLTVL